MPQFRYSGSLAVVGLVLSMSAAHAGVDFTFSITNTQGTVSGTAMGEILGLTNNATGPAAKVLITSLPPGMNSQFSGLPIDATAFYYQYENSFTVTNNQITAADFFAYNNNGAQLFINGDGGANYLNVDTGDAAYVYAANGFAGTTFARLADVPEPSSLALMATGLIALGFAWRRFGGLAR